MMLNGYQDSRVSTPEPLDTSFGSTMVRMGVLLHGPKSDEAQ